MVKSIQPAFNIKTSHQEDFNVVSPSCKYPRITTPTEIHKVSWIDVILNRAPAHYKNRCEVRCLNCKNWFNSPIQFGDEKSFSSATISNIKVSCPLCGKVTDCSKSNMRFK